MLASSVRVQHRSYTFGIAGAYGFHEMLDAYAVNASLQFGPAIKAIAAGDHQLRIMQGENGSAWTVEMGIDLVDGG